jgi:hypothetical protein
VSQNQELKKAVNVLAAFSSRKKILVQEFVNKWSAGYHEIIRISTKYSPTKISLPNLL